MTAREEAKALRAEVVRWVQDGEAGETIADELRNLVRDGVREQVQMALSSREFGRNLAEQLRIELAGHFAKELRSTVEAEVRRALAGGILNDRQLDALQDELWEKIRAQLRSRRVPTVEPTSRGRSSVLIDFWRRHWVGGIVAVLLLAVLIVALMWSFRDRNAAAPGAGRGGVSPPATQQPASSEYIDRTAGAGELNISFSVPDYPDITHSAQADLGTAPTGTPS